MLDSMICVTHCGIQRDVVVFDDKASYSEMGIAVVQRRGQPIFYAVSCDTADRTCSPSAKLRIL